MSRSRLVTDTIKELEYDLAKQKAVLAKFPDAKIHYYSGFSSKEVNHSYTKYFFERRRNGVWVIPYCEVEFEHDGKTENVKVHSKPRANRLVYFGWNGQSHNHIIKFSRIAINFKNNEFKEDMLNSCRAEIMSFIKNNPKYKMDDKHLEPKLKKLLVFI
jgi:hypothetical protein